MVLDLNQGGISSQQEDPPGKAPPTKRAKANPQLEAPRKVLSIKKFGEEPSGNKHENKHEIAFQLFKSGF